MVEGNGLENRRTERFRGFESYLLRQYFRGAIIAPFFEKWKGLIVMNIFDENYNKTVDNAVKSFGEFHFGQPVIKAIAERFVLEDLDPSVWMVFEVPYQRPVSTRVTETLVNLLLRDEEKHDELFGDRYLSFTVIASDEGDLSATPCYEVYNESGTLVNLMANSIGQAIKAMAGKELEKPL